MKKIKKYISLMLIVNLLCILGASAAKPNVNIQTSRGNLLGSSYTFDLNHDTGCVIYDAQVEGVSDVSSVYVSTVIQRRINGSWVNVPNTFLSETSTTNFALVGQKRYVEKGYWYRLHSTFIATKDGVESKDVQDSPMEWYN